MTDVYGVTARHAHELMCLCDWNASRHAYELMSHIWINESHNVHNMFFCDDTLSQTHTHYKHTHRYTYWQRILSWRRIAYCVCTCLCARANSFGVARARVSKSRLEFLMVINLQFSVCRNKFRCRQIFQFCGAGVDVIYTYTHLRIIYLHTPTNYIPTHTYTLCTYTRLHIIHAHTPTHYIRTHAYTSYKNTHLHIIYVHTPTHLYVHIPAYDIPTHTYTLYMYTRLHIINMWIPLGICVWHTTHIYT